MKSCHPETASRSQGLKHSARFIIAIFAGKGTSVNHNGYCLTWTDRVHLTWGKLRRQYLILFRPNYVRKSIAKRKGECGRCGCSCQLLFSCPLLIPEENFLKCELYDSRPRVCRLFPIDEKDLRDRNRIQPDTICGYWFES